MELTETRLEPCNNYTVSLKRELGKLHGVVVSLGKDNHPGVFPSLVNDGNKPFTLPRPIKRETDLEADKPISEKPSRGGVKSASSL